MKGELSPWPERGFRCLIGLIVLGLLAGFVASIWLGLLVFGVVKYSDPVRSTRTFDTGAVREW